MGAQFVSSIFFLLLLLHTQTSANAATSKLPVFDRMYQFGDSYSDTGNSMMETNQSNCFKSPYGRTFFGKPTGRCSDGLQMVDYFARAFKPPFLNTCLKKDSDFSHGVNFAVNGATALDASRYPNVQTNSTLSVQLGWFKDHLKSVCASSSSSGDCKRKLGRSVFVVGEVGGNDYNYPLLAGKPVEDLYTTVPHVVRSIRLAVRELLNHGAVHVIVPGNFPIGCVPVYHNAHRSNITVAYDDLGCLKPLNKFTNYHNKRLQQAMKVLQKQFSKAFIYYGDNYSAFRWILRDAASLGFEEDTVFKPCCGNVTHECGTSVFPVFKP